MEINDLLMLAAASLLSGSVFTQSEDGGRSHQTVEPTQKDIEVAVKVAASIWSEVCKQRELRREAALKDQK